MTAETVHQHHVQPPADPLSQSPPSAQSASAEDIIERFARTTDEIFSLGELRTLLTSGRQICIKYGVDVTAPQLHIGHAVNLWMMRRLQDLGHKVLLLIGDATTRVGDPTGRSKLRPIIPFAEIEANAQALIAQASMVLRFDDPNLLEIRRNSEWYDRMPASELLALLAMVTHARLTARDMFRERLRHGGDIHMHELIYPVLQGYDSVALASDLTIIGSDQLYNEMLGCFYQERLGQRPQVIITTKITPGLDGSAKQSKSLGNYIGLGHSPRDKFGRIMTLPDALIATYLRVYTELQLDQVAQIEEQIATDPMAAKELLAREIVARYHGHAVADAELRWFRETFRARKTPQDVPSLALDEPALTALAVLKRFFGERKSNGELRRLIAQGGVSANGIHIADADRPLSLRDGDMFRVGKRTWFRVQMRVHMEGEKPDGQ
jgi:tyrosyl-tRNA synthetase